MSLLDYAHPKTRRTWRIAAAVALALGAVGLLVGHGLTVEVIRQSVAHPDAVHTFAVADKYYVTPGLGLARNLVLMISIAVGLTAFVVLLHRELRWYVWDRHLPK